MKSFAKAFRATLSIALVLCMVMSFVTVSADATPVTVAEKTAPSRLTDGYYSVQYTVSGITASADADATIMVYDKDAAISKDTIKYANQADATEGSATFTMEVPAGVYTVVAGGTGATSGTAILAANTAPVFTTASYSKELDTDAVVGTVVAEGVVAADVDGQTLSYTLEGSDKFAYENGNVVTTAALEAGTYSLTLKASDGIAEAVTATITVTVKAATIVVDKFVYDSTDITVDYGTSNLTFPEIKFGDVEFDAEWICKEGYDALVAGDYTFVATVSAKEGYNIESAAAPSIKVTVKKAQINAFDAIEAKNVAYGTAKEDIGLPATVTAGTYSFEVEEWVCDKEYTATEGAYTFTATLKANANYEVAADAKATVVVNVGAKPAEKVTISSFDEVKLEKSYFTGTQASTIIADLAKEVKGYDADGNAYGPFAITWTADVFDPDSTAQQTITGTVTVEDTAEYDYTVAEDANNIEIKVELTVLVFEGTINPDLGTIYVTRKTEYEDLNKPSTITVTYDGGKTYEATIIWPEEAEWIPPYAGESGVLNAQDLSGLPENITYTGLMPYVTIATVNDNANVKLNGKDNENGLILNLENAINVEVEYNDITTGQVSYSYAVTTLEGEAVTEGVEIKANGNTATIELTNAKENDQYIIWAYVSFGEEEVASDSMPVYMTTTEYAASVYVNPSESNPTYSAIRVNKAAGMTVKAVFENFNDAEYDFPGTFKFELLDYATGDEVVKAKVEKAQSVTYSPEELANLNGAYTVKVSYIENDEVLRSVIRTTNITNAALWYTDLTINDKSGAVIANRNKKLVHKFTLSDLGGVEKVYVGSELAGYGATPADGVELKETTDTAVTNELDVKDVNVGTYTLYALAKLTEDQSYYDLTIGRTVYLQNSLSSVCNVKLNGKTHSVPEEIANGLSIEPVWGGSKIDGATYTAQFYKLEGTEYVPVGEEVSFKDVHTFTDIDSLTFKSKVVLNVIIDGEVDKTVEKIFYVVK